MYLGYQQGKIKFYTQQPLDNVFYNLDKVEETQDEYILDGEEYVLKDEAWEAKKEQEEKERIAKLYLTGADVERGIFKARGADFEDIIKMIGQMQIDSDPRTEGIELKALKIELKANNFYRGNPYVSAIGALLGFSDNQLDKFFEDGNYEHLLSNEQITEEDATIENENSIEV